MAKNRNKACCQYFSFTLMPLRCLYTFLALFWFGIFICTGSFDLTELEDPIFQDAFITYEQVPAAIRDRKNKSVTVDNIKLTLCTENNPEICTPLDLNHPIGFPSKSPIVFIIHGWKSRIQGQQWCEELKDAFFKKNHLYHIILVDWSLYSNQGYFVAIHDIEEIASILGEFIVRLYKVYFTPLANFLIVGHSLGAQTAGFIGKRFTEMTNKKLPRIIALDAAGPDFETRPESERLNRNDADVVEVIHTSMDNFGFNGSCGTIDIFPNGGVAQPGCVTTFYNIACSHKRSVKYLAAGLLHPAQFLARKCDSWDTYVNDRYSCDDEYVSLGDLQTIKTGNFYLTTTDAPPYYQKMIRY